jgi:hypothetical protein
LQLAHSLLQCRLFASNVVPPRLHVEPKPLCVLKVASGLL